MKACASLMILVALFTSCATASPEKYQATIDTWKGRSSVDVIHAWGPPSFSEMEPDGTKAIIYTYAEGKHHCVTTFVMDSSDRVAAAAFDGKLCRSK